MKQKLLALFAWRALLETILLGALLLVGLLSLGKQLPPNVPAQGILLAVIICTLWFGLRAPLGQEGLPRRLASDLLNAAAMSLLWGPLMLLVISTLGLGDAYRDDNMGRIADLFLFLGGFLFLLLRLAQRLWLYWNRLRKRKLVWALTHAQLSVVVVSALLVAAGLSLLTLIQASSEFRQEATLAATFIDRLVLTLFPMAGLAIFFTGLVMAVILPPAALVSYWIARRVTRRLDALTATSRALRDGQYSARVAVSGEDEVAELQADFNAMAAELEHTLADLQAERDKVAALLESRRALSASVSHELRTPVATVRSYLEPLLGRKGEELPVGLHAELSVIDREVTRLGRLIDDLFTLSQSEAGGLDLRQAPVDVGQVASRLAETFAPLAWGQKRVEVACEVPAPGPIAQADEGRLEQILANLLRNAIRHTPPGGIVAVQVALEGAFVCLQVRDTGSGIPAEALPHIWERFYRLPAADGLENGGAGLGLALVKELAEAMGGNVAVESQVSLGSCFTVCLPLAEGEVS